MTEVRDSLAALLDGEPPFDVSARAVLAVSARRRTRVLLPVAASLMVGAALTGTIVVAQVRNADRRAAVAGPGGLVSALLGDWAVHTGAEPGTTRVIVADGAIQIWRPGAQLRGTWRASRAGGFVANFSMVEGLPYSPTIDNGGAVLSSAPWLVTARQFRLTAGGWEALADDGSVLATFTPDPSKGAGAGSLGLTPATADRKTAMDAVPVSLPPGAMPLTADALVGTWVPDGLQRGYVTLNANRTFVGSDGCNGRAGRWTVDRAHALLLAGQGFTTDMACRQPSRDVEADLQAARAVGFVDGKLVLYAGDGSVSSRLMRGTASAP